MSKPEVETVRMHQANERTMLAWIRTGITLVALGFAIAKLTVLPDASGAMRTSPGAVVGGVGLILTGTITNVLATVRFWQVRRAIERGDVGAPGIRTVIAFGGLAVTAGLAVAWLAAR